MGMDYIRIIQILNSYSESENLWILNLGLWIKKMKLVIIYKCGWKDS